VDIASVSSLLGSLKAATEIAKFFRESDLTLEKAEAKMKLADLISALADAKIEASQVQQDLHEKDQEILRLQSRIRMKESLTWEQPYYWAETDGRKDGPFCQHCYDGEGKVVRLQGDGRGYWNCKVCKNNYTDKSYVEDTTVYSVPRHDPYSSF
jgi:hypothetical protein